MEASCSSSRFDDESTEDFCFEVPILNLNIKEPEVLIVNNAEKSKNVMNSEPIVIEETEALIDVQKKAPIEEDNSIVIDDEEKANIKDIDLEITALDTEINNEIIKKTDKNLKECDTTIDLDKETDNVRALDGNRTNSDVLILDGNKTNLDSTIILNDDEINEFTHNKFQHTDVIDVDKDTDCSIVNVSLNVYDKTEKEFRDLIQKCISMKNSAGMTRVINRTLLVIYKDVEESCKKSDEFKKVIANTSTQLDAEPERKFSHIKNLCDWLKQHIIKKKVPFITLDKRKEKGDSTIIPQKRAKFDIIDLVNDTTTTECNGTACKPPKTKYTVGKVYPSIDLESSDEDDDDVILLNKENTETVQNRNHKKSKPIKKRKIAKRKVGRPRKCPCEKPNTTQLSNISDPAMLLEPRMSVRVETPEETRAKINDIETQIAHLKAELEKMEEAEVLMDDYSSPYLVCEQIKATIVNLYKNLCQITGTNATKRHEVRLHVVPGHAEGPVRCLEEFLNANIDEDGNLPFPDMPDVTQCVFDANYKYKLGWTTGHIYREAEALFTQFGQSMQKRRQKREWKDMLSFAKSEVIDPAEEDPVLHARLEENQRIATRKELDLLDRFAQMEFGINPASEQDLQVCSSSQRGLLRVDQSEESDEDSDQGDNDYGNLHISRSDTEKASETVNGEGFGTATLNAKDSQNPKPTMIQVHGFETATKNTEDSLNKATPMIQVRSFETTKNTEDSLNKATPMIQVRTFETAKNTEDSLNKAIPMIQVRTFETTKNTEDSLNKATPMIQVSSFETTKNTEDSLNKATPMIQVRSFETAKNTEDLLNKATPMIQVRSFETTKNTEDLLNKATHMIQVRSFETTKNTEDSLNKATPSIIQVCGLETTTKTAEDSLNVKPSVVQIQGAVCVSGNGIVSNTNKIVDNVKYRTILNASNSGNIVIQPTIQYLPDENTSLTTSSNFSSEYNRFINTYNHETSPLKVDKLPTNHGRRNTKSKPIIYYANRTKCNETDVEKAAKFAQDIISLVQSDLFKNCLANNNSDHISNSPCNPTVRLTQLNLNDLPSNTYLNKNPASMSDNVNNLGSTTAQVLTHTTRCKNVNTSEVTQSIELNKTTDNITSSVLENEMEEIEAKVEEQAIKPEPLDIPRMLEELGEGFTATIFDIEDPFLVIEISDSSDSEEENLEDA